MERIETPLLTMVEAFGTRNQGFALESSIVPTYDVAADVLGSLRLVGVDSATTGIIASGGTLNTSVRVETDLYVTGCWIQEPRCTAADSLVVLDAFLQRNQAVGFQQYTPLSVNDRQTIGGGSTGGNPYQRIWRFRGYEWGFLMRAGDILSCTVFNAGAAATTTGFTLGIRGFSGPPA